MQSSQTRACVQQVAIENSARGRVLLHVQHDVCASGGGRDGLGAELDVAEMQHGHQDARHSEQLLFACK